MKYSKDFLNTKTTPDYFRTHVAIVAAENIHKMFDEVGVDDFTTSGNISGTLLAVKEIIDLNYIYPAGVRSSPTCPKIDQLTLAHIFLGTEHIENHTDLDHSRINAALKDDMGKIIFKYRTPLKTVINSLVSRSKKVKKHPQLTDKLSFAKKHLSTKGKTYKVVLSTDPWDILTMSMRGIKSCMEWGSTHARHLVGSVLDPNTAVIYATDDTETDYGSKMIYRSVVRLVKSNLDPKGKYYLYVEGAYSKSLTSGLIDRTATEMFREVLKKHIKGNKEIVNIAPYNKPSEYFIPVANEIGGLIYYDRSCVDSGMQYR